MLLLELLLELLVLLALELEASDEPDALLVDFVEVSLDESPDEVALDEPEELGDAPALEPWSFL